MIRLRIVGTDCAVRIGSSWVCPYYSQLLIDGEMAFLNESELASIGFACIGRHVLVSRKASIYNPGNISIGDHVRIDDFCVISAGAEGISIGSYVHIAIFSSLTGAEHIALDDFAGLSSRVSIYSSSDDYSGATLTNPTVPDEFRKVAHGPVRIGRHVIVGAGSIILPGVTLMDGCAVGALSLVTKSHPEFTIISGVPARRIGNRKRDLLMQETQLRFREDHGNER